MLIKAKTLKGYKLDANDGEVGKVKELYFDDKHWAIRYLVADTGNWLAGRQVLISPYALISVNQESETISVNLNKKQIEESPSLDSDKPISKQFETAYNSYYRWPAYWNGLYIWGGYPYLNHDSEEWSEIKQQEESWDPNLLSTYAVSSFHIQASEGEIGHVEDFVINDVTWAIRYLIIDTKNWFGEKKVLISPKWIDHISWSDSKVFINLSMEDIKNAPEYSEEALLTRDYETQLHLHYKHNIYWSDRLGDRLL
jgi:uncharacterized protein YrrD